eukprot:16191_6
MYTVSAKRHGRERCTAPSSGGTERKPSNSSTSKQPPHGGTRAGNSRVFSVPIECQSTRRIYSSSKCKTNSIPPPTLLFQLFRRRASVVLPSGCGGMLHSLRPQTLQRADKETHYEHTSQTSSTLHLFGSPSSQV